MTASVICAVWAVVQVFRVPVLPYDDAFITFRYVDNLVHGAGLTYNPPLHVWGFTSPLYVLWLSLLHLGIPSVPLPTLAVRSNAIFVLTTGAAAFLLMWRYTADVRLASLAACVLLVHPSLLSISSGGMESMLFLSLVLFAMFSMTGKRPAATGILLGASFLARPEAIVLLPIALLRYWRTPRELFSVVAIAGAVAGAWLAFAGVYFHSVVPLSIIAKNRPLYPLPAGHALGVIFGYMGPEVLGRFTSASPSRNVAVSAILAVSIAASLLSPRLRARDAWMPGTAAVLLTALYWYGNPMFFEWYLPVILGTVVLAVLVGGFALPDIAALRWAAPMWLAIVTVLAYADNAGGHSKSIRFVNQDGTRLRVLAYRAIGQELTAITKGTDSAAAPEVGAFGYYYRGPVIDACGLVSPEAVGFLPVPDDERAGPATGAISVALVRATNPDWIVSMPIFSRKSLLQSDWFCEHYALYKTVPLPKICFNDATVLVFGRRR